MIQLTTFQELPGTEFNNATLQSAIVEINNAIKENAMTFRILIDFDSGTIESKLYKHGLTGYFLSRGFKIVNYPKYMFIDWSSPTVYTSSPIDDRTITDINYLGNYFRADELYLILTANFDMKKISYRVMRYYILNEIKLMATTSSETSTISLGVPTELSGQDLNSLLSPELLKLSYDFPDVLLSFEDAGLLSITLNSVPELYTDIPYEILFGTRYRFD